MGSRYFASFLEIQIIVQRGLQVIELLPGRRGLSWDRLQGAHLGALDQQEQLLLLPQGVLLLKPDADRIYGLSGLGLPKVCS
jgi:hypothetical protein